MKSIIITAPEQNNVTDGNMYFRRVHTNTIYAVLTQETYKSLRRRKLLDEYLQQRKDSGIIIEVVK